MYRSGQAKERLMIKDIMVHLDGSAEDEIRLAYAEIIASTWGVQGAGVRRSHLGDADSLGVPDADGSLIQRGTLT
jgi:hypothetical protein